MAQRNFNRGPIFIPNGGGEEEPEVPRSTGFGADMDAGRMTTYFSGDRAPRTVYRDTPGAAPVEQQAARNITPAEQMFSQLGQIVERGKAERQRKRNLDDAALSFCMVDAKQGNGFVSPDVLEAVSAQLGQEITGGNYTSDGNFILYGRQPIRNAQGQVVSDSIVPIAVANRETQLRTLQRSGLGQSLQRALWDGMTGSGGLTKQQLIDRGLKNPYEAEELAAAKTEQKAAEDLAKRQARMEDSLALDEAKANRRAARNAARDAERRRLAAQNEEDRWVRQNYRRFKQETRLATEDDVNNSALNREGKLANVGDEIVSNTLSDADAIKKARDLYKSTVGAERRAEQFFEEPQARGASPQAGAEGAGETPEPEEEMPTRGDSQHTFIDLSEVDDPNRRAQILIGAQPGSVAEVDGETRMLVGGQWVPAVNVNGRWAPIQ